MNKLKTIARFIYEGLFGLSIFFISYTISYALYIWVLQFFVSSLYTPQGELKTSFINPVYFVVFGLVMGIINTYYLGKNKLLTKIAPYLIVISFPFSFILGHFSHFSIQALERTPERLAILKSIHGERVEPCNVLKIGDNLKTVHSYYGVPLFDGLRDLTQTKSGLLVDGKDFQLPFQAPIFSIYFDPESETILEIECFNGKWKKARGTESNTVYDYIEE